MTMERAVNLLSQDDEETLVSAARYIQKQCLRSGGARTKVRGPVFSCVAVVVKTIQTETKTRPRQDQDFISQRNNQYFFDREVFF